MDRFDFVSVLLTFSAVAVFSTACARPPAPGPAKDEGSAALMTLEELRGRAVAYADSVRSLADVRPTAFSSTINATLVPIEAGSDVLETGKQPLASGYTFFADYVPYGWPPTLPIHTVGFSPSSGVPFTEGRQEDCVWEATAAGKQLETLGFHRGAERPFQRGRIQRYWRDLAEDGMVFDASLMTYKARSEAGEKTCVYAIRYGGGEK